MSTATGEAIDDAVLTEFRSLVRGFADSQLPMSATRAVVDGAAYDLGVWRRVAGELGACGLRAPEELGGAAAPLALQAVVFEEFGRTLAPTPLLATTGLALELLLELGGSDDLVSALAAGERTATVAFLGPDGDWSGAGTPARFDAAAGTVTGSFGMVLDGASADELLVVARTDAGSTVVVRVDPASSGVTRRALVGLDLTREVAAVDLDGAPAEAITDPAPDVPGRVATALRRAMVLMSAESAGAARRALELAVDYVKVRWQFNRPIGSFQAIKHRAADMFARAESISAIVDAAVEADGSEQAPELAHVAKAYLGPAFLFIASENVQLHGGIGFTWEHDAHLYFRRARSSDAFFGGSVRHRAAYAALRGW
jgi:alkylation response protein AidB-like acyl-CoA dehydrogenase